MTRRQRRISIINGMGKQRADYVLRQMLATDDAFDMFTDEALTKLARKLVHDLRFGQKLNAENRAIREGKGPFWLSFPS